MARNNGFENVLILQGGGSLGAFGCAVFKALAETRVKIDTQKLDNIHKKYQKMMKEHGAEIKKIVYITREERFPSLYENTDFTQAGIKNLIKEGESKTKQALRKIGL
jgi:hypothetical protein